MEANVKPQNVKSWIASESAKGRRRILFVVYSMEYGGMEKHLVDLVTRLNPAKIDCTIMCCGVDCYSKRLHDRHNLRVICYDRSDPPKSSYFYWLAFRRLKPHSIVFVKGSVDVFPLRAYLAGKVAGVRRIYGIEHITVEPMPPKVVGSGLWNLTRRLAGYRARYIMTYVSRIWLAGMLCNRTICVSHAIRERLIHEYGFCPERTVTIANGVNLKHFDIADKKSLNRGSPHLNIDPHETVIVCLARLVPRKRIDVLLEALSILTKDGISYKCLIVGSGPLECELRERPGVLGISEHVDFVGYAGDVRPYLSVANIYVAPSDKEGLPLTLIEAMAFGLPCIATNIAGHNEVVINGSTGLLIPPGAPREMAEAIKYLMTHKEERIRMGFNGRKRVEDFFDIENTMAKIINVLLDGV